MKAMRPKGRKRKGGNWFKYEFAFMRKVVQEYLDGHESLKKLSKRYNITYGSIAGWYKRYRLGLEPFNEVSLAIMSQDQPQQQDNQIDLQKQNEELLKKLEQANLKITGLEIMIDIAEEQLGVDIRKNSGAKQSEDYANTTLEQA